MRAREWWSYNWVFVCIWMFGAGVVLLVVGLTISVQKNDDRYAARQCAAVRRLAETPRDSIYVGFVCDEMRNDPANSAIIAAGAVVSLGDERNSHTTPP